MMSSVDLNSSSANSSSTQRTNSFNPPSRYASGVPSGLPQRTGSPVPHPHSAYHSTYAGGASGVPPGAEAGRLKTEQYVLEFLYKVTELVLQSRVHLPADTARHQTSSARRGWLNLAIEEIQHIRDSLGAWRDDVHIPLTIDVFWDGDPDQRVLLERWSIVYTDGFPAPADQFDTYDAHGRRHSSNMTSYASAGKSRDVVQILREMMKKMAVLLRALHAFMRLLPAHRFFRQSYPSTLSYEIHSCDESELHNGFEADVATSYYSFLPINTPFGFVKASAIYRRDCTALERRRKKASKEIFHDNFIIQDYVPASPELMPASAPTSRQAIKSPIQSTPLMMPTPTSPRRLSTPHPDDMIDHRRRSSPEMTVDDVAGRPGALQRIQAQHTSQPMAIPQQVKSPGPVVFDDRAESAASALEMPATKPVAIPHHPHSYDDPARLRTIPTNPNVTAAPYGYGNVAVERSQTPPIGALSTSSGGFSGGGGSYQDHHLSSPHHPLSTPPRHPNSVLTPRMSGRTSFVSSVSGGKRSSNDYAYRASLENFSLDNSSPSNAVTQPAMSSSPPATTDRAQTFHFGGRRTGSFDSQRSATPELPGTTSSGDGSRHSSGTSFHLTPPFVARSSPTNAEDPASVSEREPSSTAALVLRRASIDQSPRLGTAPGLSSTPPSYHANPSELLSTSPGYSHSKHFETLRRGSTPTFTSTDSAARSGSFHFATGTPRGVSGSILAVAATAGRSSGNSASSDSKDRAFSTDIQANTGGIWGISPDSPDKFAISIGASTRRRFLAPSDGTSGELNNSDAGATDAAYGAGQVDPEMFMLPFALGDDAGTHSSGTTVTATSSTSERPSLGSESDSQPRAAAPSGILAWDTVSVGSFLQQLKNAPRLQTFETSIERRTSSASAQGQEDTTTMGSIDENAGRLSSTAPSFFDDELESFRNLRNELSQAL